MNRISLINLSWTCYSGFIFQFIHLELWKPVDIDAALFGIRFTKYFLYVSLFWFEIEIFNNEDEALDKFLKNNS